MKGTQRIPRRKFLLASVASMAGVALAACSGPSTPAPAATAKPGAAATTAPAPGAATSAPAKPAAGATAAPAAGSKLGAQLVGKLEGPEIIRDVSKYPKTFKEAPMLAELVKAGKLPPVEKRLPDPTELMVTKPLFEIGKYGGNWRRAFTGPGDQENGQRIVAADKLIFTDHTGQKTMPSVAKDWKTSDDGKVFSLFLRKGLKWSDGDPFDADDIMFWWDDMHNNKELNTTPSPNMYINGKLGTIVKIDAFTVEFRFPEAYYMFENVIRGNTPVGNGLANTGRTFMGGYAPEHYLKQYHSKYAKKEDLDKKVADAKMDNWVNLMKFKNDWALNVELPVVGPWRTTGPVNTPAWILERNPYFWEVDTEGNQLPYIDKITMGLGENLEVINLRAIAGEYDLQGRHEDMSKLPILLENQQKSNYKIHLDTGDFGADVQLYCNQSYDADPEIAKWITTADFRRALSLGIDRDQLNEVFWLGMGTPGSPVVSDAHPHFPGPEYRTMWHVYDPKKASEMLDKIGLDKKDSEGYRLRTDGKGRLRLEITTIKAAWVDQTAICEMVSQHWKKIGIQGDVSEQERSLMERRTIANELHIAVRDASTVEALEVQPTAVIPATYNSPLGPFFGVWFATVGARGKEPKDPAIRKVLEIYKGLGGLKEQERNKACQEIWKIAVDQVWGIGTCGLSAQNLGVRLVSNKMGNVPGRLAMVRAARHPGSSHPQTYYFKS